MATLPPPADAATAAASENDSKQVFVGNLPFKLTHEALIQFCESAGKVMEATIVKHGRRSLGYGFVLFETPEEANKARMQLDKTELEGRQVNVEVAKTVQAVQKPRRQRRRRMSRRRSSALSADTKEKNDDGSDEQDKDQQEQAKSTGGAGRRRNRRHSSSSASQTKIEPSKTMVFVANLPYATTDDQLRDLFKGYDVVSAQVGRARSGRSKGFGFVDLKSEDEQQRALKEITDVELDGRIVYLRVANYHPPKDSSDHEDAAEAAAATTATGNDEQEKEQPKEKQQQQQQQHEDSPKEKVEDSQNTQ